MKLLAIFLAVSCAIPFALIKPPGVHPHHLEVARCVGNTPCNACKNCSACQWCNSGGTCGICTPVLKKKPAPNPPTPSYSSQCKATTQRGTRCSRKSRSNGYCWQHGG